jgi:L-fuculose-phosphate aldolase
MPPNTLIQRELASACKVLYLSGATGDGLGGHLSVRLDADSILIKPRPVSWRHVTPDDLILIDFSGNRVDQPDQPASIFEWPIHARIYAARPDVQCVFHAHPSASTMLAALGIAVEPIDQDCAALTDRLPVLDNGAVSISTPARGDEVARALDNFGALLLKNHGAIVVGSGIAEVVVGAHKLEKVAETMLRAAALAKLPIVAADKKAAILAARKGVESDSMNQERWLMLQDYYLGRTDGR